MAAGFNDLLTACGIMLSAPGGYFAVTKSERIVFQQVKTDGDLKFKVTETEDAYFEVTE